MQISSSSTTTSESQDPSSGDPAVSALQQQLLLMVARRTQPETPRVRSSRIVNVPGAGILKPVLCSDCLMELVRSDPEVYTAAGLWLCHLMVAY